jgi:hypothetical protein
MNKDVANGIMYISTHAIAGAIASIHMRTSEIIQIVACDKYDCFQCLKLHIFMKTCFKRLFNDKISPKCTKV